MLCCKHGIGEPFTGDFERARLENFILSEARETHYLSSETTAYIRGGKQIEGNNTEDRRK